MNNFPARPWFDLRLPQEAGLLAEGPDEFVRLWRGFMTARVTLGLVLVTLQSTLYALGQSRDKLLIMACGAYLVATLATRVLSRPRRLGRTFDPLWLSTIGVDLVAFGMLQFVQGHAGINYTPLMALPVLLASVLGSLPLAMGTAAGAALLLLAQAMSLALDQSTDSAPLFAQAALTGAGYFVIAFLANQLSAGLASEEQRSRRHQIAVQVQRQVNALVIESLTDGILVVDLHGMVWAANPAACKLLARTPVTVQTPFDLATDPLWRELGRMTALSFSADLPQHANLVFNHAGAGPQHVEVRTRMTAPGDGGTGRLCVMFLEDQREMEARMRTEKLASMGRMSTAVAHEIRNPLAAIVQANALLDEGVDDPELKRLIQMVQQNARRLENIVDEVLNISRVQNRLDETSQRVQLNEAVARICKDWSQHTGSDRLLEADLCAADPVVAFDSEHLRRVLINLLDNARRYASGRQQAIQVSTRIGADGNGVLGIWSDGQPMEQSVERHLFEPFFSSESRSTGLGLYICRELCERHGALIGFERSQRAVAAARVDGNEFLIRFDVLPQFLSEGSSSDKIPTTPWLPNRR
ncbi:MAG: PAS domain-containing sensor histidine kinase [Rhodoferax sp.]|nr:PAS domain-containing sensor histidine kinase [Rhodoferax sp.]